MDIEKLTNTGYRTSVMIAVVLSCMLVTFASLLGRGTLNLKGALLQEEHSEVTIIAAVEPKLADGVTIRKISFLRKRENTTLKPYYDYLVSTSDARQYLVSIHYDDEAQMWTLLHFEHLHGDTTTESSGM
jgi:hypothetical protein